MVTDDERRRVAEMLRMLNPPSMMAMMSILGVGGKDVCARLADLIDPDTTFDTAKPDEDTTSRALDMLYVTYSRSTCGPDGRAYMVKVRHRAKGWERDFYAVDREALLALADGLEADADRIIKAAKNARFGVGPRMSEAKLDADEWRSIARRIREACKEVGE